MNYSQAAFLEKASVDEEGMLAIVLYSHNEPLGMFIGQKLVIRRSCTVRMPDSLAKKVPCNRGDQNVPDITCVRNADSSMSFSAVPLPSASCRAKACWEVIA